MKKKPDAAVKSKHMNFELMIFGKNLGCRIDEHNTEKSGRVLFSSVLFHKLCNPTANHCQKHFQEKQQV